MNKNFLFFVGGIIIGGAIGILGTKKYLQNKYQKRYEEDKEALEDYYDRVDEYARQDSEEESKNNKKDVDVESIPSGRMSAEERAEIKKKLNKNWEGTTNYANIYKNKNHVDELKNVDPGDLKICANCINYDSETNTCCGHESVSADDCCDEFENGTTSTPEEEAFEEHQKNKNKPPKIISMDAYENLPAYIDHNVLYFYAYDEVLVDEDNEDEPITEPELLIGDALTKYNFIDSDEKIIFIMNYATDTCYEVQKVDASWSYSH